MHLNDLRTICTSILRDGGDRFDTTMGIVSRIDSDSDSDSEIYEVIAVDSASATPRLGEQFSLRAVYCRDVYETGKTIALTEINGVPGLCLHPLYRFIPCEVYISSPILVAGSVWGTLNYTSMILRDEPFSEADIQYNEARAAHIASIIEAMES